MGIKKQLLSTYLNKFAAQLISQHEFVHYTFFLILYQQQLFFFIYVKKIKYFYNRYFISNQESLENMSKFNISIQNLDQFNKNKSYQAIVPKSAIYLTIESKQIQICQNFLIRSGIFQDLISQLNIHTPSKISQGKKIVLNLNNPNISLTSIKKINQFFINGKIQIERSQSIASLIQSSEQLQIYSLVDYIIKDLEQNFQQYDFFLVYSLSKRFKYSFLQSKCLSDLKKYKFEQLNYSRYGLLQCQIKIFLEIIDLCLNFKVSKPQKGPSKSDLKEIINQYNSLYQLELDANEIVSKNLQLISEVEQSEQQCHQIDDQNTKSTAQQQQNEQLDTENVFMIQNQLLCKEIGSAVLQSDRLQEELLGSQIIGQKANQINNIVLTGRKRKLRKLSGSLRTQFKNNIDCEQDTTRSMKGFDNKRVERVISLMPQHSQNQTIL